MNRGSRAAGACAGRRQGEVDVPGREQVVRLGRLGLADPYRQARMRAPQQLHRGHDERRRGLENAPTRTRPTSPRRYPASSASARSGSAQTASARSRTSSAASVSRTRRPSASSDRTPSCRARFVSCCDTADGVISSASAVAVTVPRSRSVRGIRSFLTSHLSDSAVGRNLPVRPGAVGAAAGPGPLAPRR